MIPDPHALCLGLRRQTSLSLQVSLVCKGRQHYESDLGAELAS